LTQLPREANSLSSDASRKNFSVPPVVSMTFRPDSHCFGPNFVSGRPAFGERFAAPGRVKNQPPPTVTFDPRSAHTSPAQDDSPKSC
jgi:hypothetical protein